MTVDEKAADLVWGVSEIGKLIGRTYQQTYHMIRMGHLPAKQIGGRWVASKSKLITALTEDAA